MGSQVQHPVGVAELEWTGERFLPDCKGQILYEHLHRYIVASAFCRGKVVVDIASGAGYGSNLLAEHAEHVTGIDIDPAAVEWSRQRYQKNNLTFLQGDCRQIPMRDRCCDVVVSFETIEHIVEHEKFLSEVKRILRPKGLLIISTPDKGVYDSTLAEPNAFHLKEMNRSEFDEILKKYFAKVDLHGQQYLEGSLIDGSPSKRLLERDSGFGIVDIDQPSARKEKLGRPTYLIAFASDARLPTLQPTLLTSDAEPQPLQLQMRLARAEEQRDGVAGRLIAAEKAVADLQARLGAAEEERSETAQRLALAERQRDGVAGRLIAAEKAVADLQAQLGAAEAGRSETAQRLALAEGQRDGAADRLAAAEKAIADLRVRLMEAQAARDAGAGLLADAEKQRDHTAARLAAAEKEADELRARLKTAEAARDAGAGRLAEAEKQRDAAAARLSAAEKDAAEAQARLKTERDETAGRLADAEKRHDRAVARLADAEKVTADLQAQLRTEREAAARRLAEAEQAAADLQARLEAESAAAARRLAEAEQAAAGLQTRLEEAEGERDAAAHRLSLAESQRDGAAERLLDAERSGQQLKARMEVSLKEAREEILRLQGERDGLIRRLLDAERAQEEAVRNGEEAFASLAALQTRFADLRTAALVRMRRELAGAGPGGPGAERLIGRSVDTAKGATLLALSADMLDPDFYRASQPDVAAAGLDPHEHFRNYGWAEGRSPNPAFVSFLPRLGGVDRNAAAVRRLFDAAHYYTGNADVRSAGVDAFEHFCEYGWKENRSPNALFSAQAYFAANPDVRHAGLNPLAHYALVGWHEGRDVGGIFDARHYLETCPDARDAGVSPLEHFVFVGLARGHRPNRSIDPAAFLSAADLELDPWQRVSLLVQRMEEAARAAGPVRLPVADAPRLSIVVYARDNASPVLSCLASLERKSPPVPFEVLLADHGSRDLLPMMAAQWPAVRYLRCDGGVPWQEAVNRAAAQARGDVLVVVDGNVEFMPWWATELWGTLERERRAGVVGGRILDVSGRLRHGGGLAWRDGSLTVRGADADAGHPRYNHMRPVDHVSPSLMAVRTDLFLEVGGFGTDFSSPDYVAADFGRKVWSQGASVLYQPLSRAVRFDADAEPGTPEERERFRAKWAAALDALPERPEREGVDLRGAVGHAVIIDHITPTPDADAGSVIQWHLIDLLLRMGWAVSFVPEVNMENRLRYTADLQRIGVHCVYAPYYQNLYEFLRDEGRTIDFAIPHRAPSAAHYLDLIRTHSPRARVLLNTCDIHYIREMRGAEVAGSAEMMEQAQTTKRYELDAIQRSDCTIVVSLYEEQIIAQELPDAKLTILPLIMDAHGLQAPLQELRDLCFIGGYRHMPNADAVHWFVREVWPLVRERLPDARFRIMGSHVPPDIQALEGNGVVVDGFVPDLASSLARCRLSVAPLRFGAGIKGKVGSSLSYGIPCVASSIASEGMGLGPCDGVEVADDPADIAERIVHLYTDDDHWRRMSAGGLAFVRREYSLRTTAARLTGILTDLNLPIGHDPFA